MEDIVHTPCDRDIESIRRISDLFQYRVRAKAFGSKFLGWGVSAEVIRFQPDAIANGKAEVLSFSIGIVFVCLLRLLDGQLTTRLYLMDVMKSFRESQGLFIRGAVGVDRVVTIVRVERGHADRRMEMVVVGEFSHM